MPEPIDFVLSSILLGVGLAMDAFEGVDGGGHPLEKKSAKAYGGGRLFIIPGAQPLDEHFSADEREKEKGGPGDEGLDRGGPTPSPPASPVEPPFWVGSF